VFLQNGFDDFISKPIDIRQLNVILNKYVRDKQPPEVIEAAEMQIYDAAETMATGDSAGAFNTDPVLIGSFIRDAEKAVSFLENLKNKPEWFLSADDLRRFIITVHGMKSSLGSIGEAGLSESARQLEVSGKENNYDYIKTSVSGFIDELHEVIVKYKQALESNTGSGNEDIADVYKKLSEIIVMCADMDRKNALDLIGGIIDPSPDTRAVLEVIKEYLIHSEFEKAEGAAAAYSDILKHRSGFCLS